MGERDNSVPGWAPLVAYNMSLVSAIIPSRGSMCACLPTGQGHGQSGESPASRVGFPGAVSVGALGSVAEGAAPSAASLERPPGGVARKRQDTPAKGAIAGRSSGKARRLQTGKPGCPPPPSSPPPPLPPLVSISGQGLLLACSTRSVLTACMARIRAEGILRCPFVLLR